MRFFFTVFLPRFSRVLLFRLFRPKEHPPQLFLGGVFGPSFLDIPVLYRTAERGCLFEVIRAVPEQRAKKKGPRTGFFPDPSRIIRGADGAFQVFL